MVEPAESAEQLYVGAIWKAFGNGMEYPAPPHSGKPDKERSGRARACVRINEWIQRYDSNETIKETPVNCA